MTNNTDLYLILEVIITILYLIAINKLYRGSTGKKIIIFYKELTAQSRIIIFLFLMLISILLMILPFPLNLLRMPFTILAGAWAYLGLYYKK